MSASSSLLLVSVVDADGNSLASSAAMSRIVFYDTAVPRNSTTIAADVDFSHVSILFSRVREHALKSAPVQSTILSATSTIASSVHPIIQVSPGFLKHPVYSGEDDFYWHPPDAVVILCGRINAGVNHVFHESCCW